MSTWLFSLAPSFKSRYQEKQCIKNINIGDWFIQWSYIIPTLLGYLSMKQGSLFVLFCFIVMRPTKLRCFKSSFWCLWKALDEEACLGLVPWRLDLQCKSSWILNDFLPKIKLKHSWKFRSNWNVLLVLLEKSQWARFNGIYLVRFGFRMLEILILK